MKTFCIIVVIAVLVGIGKVWYDADSYAASQRLQKAQTKLNEQVAANDHAIWQARLK
jgi:cell division protein FtsL